MFFRFTKILKLVTFELLPVEYFKSRQRGGLESFHFFLVD